MDFGVVFIGTPIGDSEDISLKALKYLKSIGTLFCEDTRKSKDLLNRLGIDLGGKVFKSLHDHSGKAKIDELINASKSELIGYLSDAGSPLISDPAYPIVKACLEQEVTFKFISSITAPVYALENSGLAPIPFSFLGFLPREEGKIKEAFSALPKGTSIFFEGVSRVEKTLKILSQTRPESSVVVARECTKTFESFHRFRAKDFKPDSIIYKGEFVILVYCDDAPLGLNSKAKDLAQEVLDKGAKPKLVAKLLAEILDKNSKEIYQELGRN